MKIKNFEELDVWKKSRTITNSIYKLTANGKFAKDWGLKDQIQRASVSIMSNIAEGFDSSSRTEFARFLSISRRSASEVQNQLYIALDQGYLNQDEFDSLYGELEKTRKMITSLITYLRSQGH